MRLTKQVYQKFPLFSKCRCSGLGVLGSFAFRFAITGLGGIDFTRRLHGTPGSLFLWKRILKRQVEVCRDVQSEVELKILRDAGIMTVYDSATRARRIKHVEGKILLLLGHEREEVEQIFSRPLVISPSFPLVQLDLFAPVIYATAGEIFGLVVFRVVIRPDSLRML